MKRIVIALAAGLISLVNLAQSYTLVSPNGRLEVSIGVSNDITYGVKFNNQVVVEPSKISMQTNMFAVNQLVPEVRAQFDSASQSVNLTWGPVKQVSSSYNQLTLNLSNAVAIQFRAYNEGFAWRFVANLAADLIVTNESSEFNLPLGTTAYYPETKSFLTPFEPTYAAVPVEQIQENALAMTPFMYKAPTGQLVVVSEANLFEYPGMFVKKVGMNTLQTIFPNFPKKEKQEFLGRYHLVKWPQLSRMVVAETEGFIAKTSGNRAFPWRVVMVAENDVQILNNYLIYLLADEPQGDFTWVKPGKVVWDWYHKWNLQGVNFKPGINTQTYKYMIDFAAKNGIEYINIDDGWCKLWNFKRVNPNLNLDEVIAYAKSRGIKVFIWAMWNTLDKDLATNLDMFQKMGVSGLKVDFFDRTDQRIVDFINRLAAECAKRNLLLNLHGMYKPTGLTCTYPNVVNIEGVLGLEYNKFSDRCTPAHNLTIPFVRNVVGPMDYTPGSMRHVAPENFKKSWDNPHSMTTRAQQMAMYIVYHGGVQMLADSPTLYEKDSIALGFLSKVPVTWDETRALSGEVGKSISVARRNGKKWYIGCMTATAEHEFNIDFNFLDDREYTMTVISGGSSDEELVLNRSKISRNDKQSFKVQARSGLVIILE